MPTQTASKSTPSGRPVYRQVRTLDLAYGEYTTAELPAPLKFLGLWAQQETSGAQEGNRRTVARTVEPQLVYLFEADKKTQPMTFLLLRGQADLPLDPDKKFDFLGLTMDRNPRHNCLSSLWLVTPKKGSE